MVPHAECWHPLLESSWNGRTFWHTQNAILETASFAHADVGAEASVSDTISRVGVGCWSKLNEFAEGGDDIEKTTDIIIYVINNILY